MTALTAGRSGWRPGHWLLSLVLAIGFPLCALGSQTIDRPDSTRPPAVDSILLDLSRVPAERLVWLIDSYEIDRARLMELAGTSRGFPMVRSTSSLFWLDPELPRGIAALGPQVQLVSNSAIPHSQNDGALWAGHGRSIRAIGGIAAKFGRLRIVIAPEFTTTQNRSLPARIDTVIPAPPIPPTRNPFSFPWYATGPYSVDFPLRFGDAPLRELRPGQSSVLVDVGRLTFGIATENEWWGPGIDNALILSNNAPGFTHLLLRSSRPLTTGLGAIEFRWLVGELNESDYFDYESGNDRRSIAAAVVTARPRRIPTLTVGVARSVIGTSTGWGEVPFRWLDVFRNTGHPNDRALNDSSLYPGGRDQVISVFGRYVIPGSGAEVYGEWGRTDLPKNLRDLFVQPNRGQAYTLGLQWARRFSGRSDLLHLRVENTSLEQGPTFRQGSAGVWYTSRRIVQGYTNEGQILGASVGPGSSGQTIEFNYFAKRAFLGLQAGRTRYNEDVHTFAPILEYLRWCSHDVGLQWGIQGGFRSKYGNLSVRSLFQNRYNAWFQGAHGCPRSVGNVDIRNNNIAVTFSPFPGR